MRGYRRLIKKSKSKKPSGVVYDYIVINTTSNSASWTPTSIVNTGNTLIWEVYDGNYSYGSLPSTPTYIYTETISNNPIFDFSSNTTGYTVVIKSTSGFSGLTALYLNTLSLTYLNVIEATSLTELSFKSNASLT